MPLTKAKTPLEHALEANKLLDQATYALWSACHADGWQDACLKATHDDMLALQDSLALAALGARERLTKLHALDPDYWRLEGEFATSPRYYTTDDNILAAVATWLFDKFGRACYRDCDSEYCASAGHPADFCEGWTLATGEAFEDARAKAYATLGEALMDEAFARWEAGRHDT